MLSLTRRTSSFPSVSIASPSGGQPIEVHLIGQLGYGTGSALVAGAEARQRGHVNFIDALDEPSARIGGMHLAHANPSTLFTFVVGPNGHPFHRHAGDRVFTAIAGSAGAQLRFSTATSEEIANDPASFLRRMHVVNVPSDSLFTVRFGGGTWHQFISLAPALGQPALFALSCHPNELGGGLDATTRGAVLDGAADIPTLTETLPDSVVATLALDSFDAARVRTTALSLHAAGATRLAEGCAWLRSLIGSFRARLVRLRGAPGFLGGNAGARVARAIAPDALPEDLLLHGVLESAEHTDGVALDLPAEDVGRAGASRVLAALLGGFVDNPPLGVTRLMRLRNALVRPLRLRTSTLGCPISSLGAASGGPRFGGRFPVHASVVRPGDRSAEVMLGADDRHLQFRSSVRVDLLPDGGARCWLVTRVATRNAFGRFYLLAIDRVHRHYIAPTLLRFAADDAVHSLGTAVTEDRALPLQVFGADGLR
jgi:hypothetical protein